MPTSTFIDAGREARIAALIETLHATEQQLEALTAGQIDTVANQAGNTFLLRRAQEQLRHLEASKQAALLDALPANIALLDPQGVIVTVNAAWRRFAVSNAMRDANHGVGRNYLEVCRSACGAPDAGEAEVVGRGLRAVLAGERGGFSLEYACDSPTESRHFVLTVTPLEAGRRAGAVIMHIDVSDRARAEQASLSTTELLHAVVDGAPDLVYVKDIQGRYLLSNRALGEFFGCPAESILGCDDAHFLRKDELAGPLESDRRVIETGRTDTSECTLTGAHERRSFHVTKAPYRNPRGEVIGLIGISRDITDSKQLAMSRDSERLLLRTLIDALPDVVYTKDTAGRYVVSNQAALAQFGLQQESELAGRTDFDLMSADLAARVQADDAGVLAGQPILHRVDHAYLTDGTPQWLSVVKVPLSNAKGQAMGLVGFSRDITQHKQAELELIEGKATLNMVGRIAKVGGWSLDIVEQRLSWSDIVATLHDEPVGFSPSLEMGLASYAPEHRHEVQTAIERCATLGTPYDVEAEKVTANGRRFWVRSMGEAVRDADGRVVRIQGAFQDITERKLAALETQRLATRLVDTLESMNEGFFAVDRAWRYTYVNHEAERVLRKSRDELIGQVMWDVYPDAQATAFEEGYRRAMAGEAGVSFEALHGPFDRWIGVDCYPSDEGLSVYFRDVTEQRAARQQLELMEASVAQLNDIVVIIEPAPEMATGARIVFVNDAFVRMTGHAREEVIGRSPEMLHGPLTDPAELARIRSALDRGETVHAELLDYRKDGHTHWIELDITPIGVNGEECSHFVAIERDITERRRNEAVLRELNASLEDRVLHRTRELERARELAEQANRAKSSFLATMSHEIRTPMNGVVGMIDVLEQSQLRPSQVDMVKTVRESAYALLAIVDDVLDFSKIEAGQFEIDREPMDLPAVVEGVCDALASLSEAQGVSLRLYTDPALPQTVLGDAARLRQLLMNLLGNAIKFSGGDHGKGAVSLRALRLPAGEGQHALALVVADNGIGMDEATLSRLFSPFTQADASTTRRFGGTGLGLSISRRLVELMGGEITVVSEPGRGSTFTVRLPIELPSLAGDCGAPPKEALAVTALEGLPCLLLGREAGPAADLGSYLRHAAMSVQEARSLPQALAWLQRIRSGRRVIVLAEPSEGVETVLAACRAAGKAQPGLSLAFVVIETGRRRKPRRDPEDQISLDAECLHRPVFLHAVAQATGVWPEEITPDAEMGVDTLGVPLDEDPAQRPDRLVLVAEDNEINQKVLTRQLAVLGFQTQMADNGAEALACWRRGGHALLLTDLHMPEMDGYHLAAAVRAEETSGARIPIIALTANALRDEELRCRQAGMDGYLTKPVRLAQLKATIEHWLPRAAAGHAALAPLSGSMLLDGASTPVDLGVLTELIGGDPQMIGEVLQAFRANSLRSAQELVDAQSAGRLRAVADTMHKLKSAARSIGALKLGQICADIEGLAHAQHGVELRAVIASFQAELQVVHRFLDSY